jgi:hypothetical protein
MMIILMMMMVIMMIVIDDDGDDDDDNGYFDIQYPHLYINILIYMVNELGRARPHVLATTGAV